MADVTSANVLDLRPRLAGRLRKERVREEAEDGEYTTLNDLGGVVLICEREMLAKDAFESFAKRAKVKTLLDLRPSASMTFIKSPRPCAFRLLAALDIQYADVAARVGKGRFRDDYWESEILALAITRSIGSVHRSGGVLACLFGSRSQLQRGRRTVLQALENSSCINTHAPVSHYRSGLFVM